MIPLREEEKKPQFRNIRETLKEEGSKSIHLSFRQVVPTSRVAAKPILQSRPSQIFKSNSVDIKEKNFKNEGSHPYKFVSRQLNDDIQALKEQMSKIDNIQSYSSTTDHEKKSFSCTKESDSSKQKELDEKVCTLEAQIKIVTGQNKVLKGELELNKQLNGTLKKQLERLKAQIFNSGSRDLDNDLQQKWNIERKTYESIIEKLQNNQHKIQKIDPEYEKASKIIDQSLKTQMKINKDLKEKLDQKSRELEQMTEKYLEKTKQIEKVKESHRISDIVAKNEQKNKIIRLEHQIEEKNSELQFSQISLDSLHNRYKKTIKELKDKDSFMMTHFINQVGCQDIAKITNVYKEMLQNHTSWKDYLMDQKELKSLRDAVEKITQ